MSHSTPAGSGPRKSLQWALLITGSICVTTAFSLLGLPAAALLGPMLCAIVAGALGVNLTTPQLAFGGGQAILGVLIASSLSPTLIPSFLSHWPMFFGVVIATLCASSLMGYLISRWQIVPGTTGVWGASPGAATAMVLIAEAFGADTRLVAFMQYLRMVMVTAVAAVVARLYVDIDPSDIARTVWFPAIEWTAFGAALVVACAGTVLGKVLRLPSPYFLGALILGVALEFPGWLTYQLPPWLLTVSYAIIGWTIGLKFDREILLRVARIVPQIAASIVILILFCGGLAALLVTTTGVDPLTAYLATSPGGMDSVAIIAAASHDVDITFIMSVQMLRFLLVLIFGPAIARGVARLVKT